MLRLNGCPQCKKHVYVPWSKRKSCPRCGTARFDTDGKPKELVYYFPVRSKLKALLKTPSYKRMVQHEFFRPRNEEVMSDVYDAPAWKDFMGAVVYPNNRIGLLFCIDGIPAFAANTLSLKPAELVNLSLPPAVRSKIENILLMMLLPSSMKGEDAKKYYDFASTYELQDLYTNGTCWSQLLR